MPQPIALSASRTYWAEKQKNTDWLLSPAHTAVHLSRGNWWRAPHLDLIANDLAQMEHGPIFRIYTLPPRHGKSELISHWTPVWFLKKWPHKRVILASYQAGFAADWGGACKSTIVDNEGTLDLRISKDTRSKSQWSIQGYGGGMIATGVLGAITGRGGHLLIIDDPIKSQKEALSETYRESIKQWYKSTFRTRAEPGASIILLMTRWHEDDLAGWLMSENEEGVEHRDPWKIVNLPALAEPDDPLGRPEGAALWPVRYDLDALYDLRQATGSYWWSAEYQGHPRPEGGGIIREEWFKYYGPGTEVGNPLDLEENDTRKELYPRRVRQFWDTAFKEAQVNDRSACVTIVDCKQGYFIPDVWVDRVEFPGLQAALKAKYNQFIPDRIEVEDKASGISLIQQIRRDTKIPIHPVKAVDDKVTRMHSISAIVEAGLVYLPVRAPWLSEFLHEICSFPTAAHDDIADAFAYSLMRLKPRRDREQHPMTRKRKKKSKWQD